MPQASQTLSLTLNGEGTVFNLAQRGVGSPTLWNRSIAADGSLVALETVSHTVKRAVTVQKGTVETRFPVVADVSGVPQVVRTLAGKTVLDIPLASTTTEKTRLCDAQIAALTEFKAALIAGEAYF